VDFERLGGGCDRVVVVVVGLQRRGNDGGGGRVQVAPTWSESAEEAAERPGSAAALGGAVEDGKRQRYFGRAWAKTSVPPTPRTRWGQARFRPRTPTSSGRGARDGSAAKFFCGSRADGFLFYAVFLTPTSIPAVILRVRAGWGIC
jgi:hypothetical protein